jgi:hypothetical protein
MRRAPWDGLRGVPAGFADGADADALGALSCSNGQVAKWNGTRWACGSDAGGTAYSAGVGLTLAGATFRVNFSGSGSSNDVARADHHHLGQTWTGSRPLKIVGSFGASDPAALYLRNSSGMGLLISSATSYGVYVYSSGTYGVGVISAGSEGVYVDRAGGNGMFVRQAGKPSLLGGSSGSNGFSVSGAEGSGLYVGRADKPEVKVSWQVTGIRQDAYAEAHRIPVEEEKPAEERGTYMHPEAHGQPEKRGLAYKLEAQETGEEGR